MVIIVAVNVCICRRARTGDFVILMLLAHWLTVKLESFNLRYLQHFISLQLAVLPCDIYKSDRLINEQWPCI